MDNHVQAHYHEHHIKRIIPGDIDSVRLRLASVLADFNYDVLSDQPLQARRVRSRNMLTATLLEQNTRLTILLKSLSPISTLVTFDYSIEFLTTKGDCQTLEREVDAIIALAMMADALTVCSGCGTENSNNVRFCRGCGMPAGQNRLPAEIEVMRLTDNARDAYQRLIVGTFIGMVTMLISALIVFLGNPSYKVTISVFTIGSVLSALAVVSGLVELHRTLNPKNSDQNSIASGAARNLSTAHSAYLLKSEPPSVTEGTTRTMDVQNAPASSGVKRSAKTTDSMD